jgi:hypothetical protein
MNYIALYFLKTHKEMLKMKIRRSKTFANKMFGWSLIIIGVLSTAIDSDALGLVFLGGLGLVLLFDKENAINI